MWAAFSLVLVWIRLASAAVDFASSGYASLTHYDLPSNYVASCGCVGRSTNYPTAAINRYAYGSNTSFGPACGACFEIRLVSTPLAPPPPPPGSNGPWGDGIYYNVSQVTSGSTPTLVVKVTDLCPGAGGPWCNATRLSNGTVEGNSLGFDLHFDLAWPAKGISKNFFPGTHDYGAWNISYAAVSCQRWAGWRDPAALGSDWAQQSSACCPNNPSPSGGDASCPAYFSTLGPNAAVPPNTSNILSRGASNAAASTLRRDAAANVVVLLVTTLASALAVSLATS
ncbi:Expansin/pollen allergen, DPBB domain protein [Kalmanozyma brasiliensis GHG001]|uniref:Expansin/pollen allergen, DPBB domain protein n=1 Tax=Kalmanozyma brasiliensis (strain GHG001) TaxID=1365824 RepID=UPI001CEBC3D8|nr:Expansin/pollen allergen, DPBB domain protein [Kalmanozyma brasiliensis GHG001]KAF6767039.1 Expansin/pollen allergen, DPBB domain protein [Kalmanozyma brasiliensis GHG001]